LQQAIKLLQLSTLEINQETARLLDENPFLEREDENTNQTYSGNSSTDTPAPAGEGESSAPAEPEARNDSSDWQEPTFSSSSSSSPDDEDDGYAEVAAERPSMREHLLWELNMSQMDGRDKKIIGLLIDALDENAYLSQPLEEIFELLPPELDISLDDLETALVQLQHLDAPGIGARNLSECLALQLETMPEICLARSGACHRDPSPQSARGARFQQT
jgi:RNA polymerase sigma-54 factor